jgi:hypothetical protein
MMGKKSSKISKRLHSMSQRNNDQSTRAFALKTTTSAGRVFAKKKPISSRQAEFSRFD